MKSFIIILILSLIHIPTVCQRKIGIGISSGRQFTGITGNVLIAGHKGDKLPTFHPDLGIDARIDFIKRFSLFTGLHYGIMGQKVDLDYYDKTFEIKLSYIKLPLQVGRILKYSDVNIIFLKFGVTYGFLISYNDHYDFLRYTVNMPIVEPNQLYSKSDLIANIGIVYEHEISNKLLIITSIDAGYGLINIFNDYFSIWEGPEFEAPISNNYAVTMNLGFRYIL